MTAVKDSFWHLMQGNVALFPPLMMMMMMIITTMTIIVGVTDALTFSSSQDNTIVILPIDVLDATCPMGYFQCNTTTQCVQQRLNCDGQADCDDASDEWNCVNDIDAKFWDHLFRKQPYGRHDDIPIGTCLWPNSQNLSCPCRGSELLCRFQQLSAIPINLPARDITMLDLTGNNFTSLSASFLDNLPITETLVLKFCGIAQLTENAFKRLSTIPVKTLYLDENKIESLPPNLFAPGNYLKILFLAGNLLTELKARVFCRLHMLQGLHLNDNRLRIFDVHAFDCLENLTSLLLTDNEFRSLDGRVLQNLTNLNYIYFSWFHLCRAALHVRVCEPHGDGISSTYHLLDNPILRGSVWVMASVAIVGNLLVLLGRYLYKTRSNVEHSLYLRHLAASDFLMGIYLAIIACADINFRGEYIVYEESWRHSALCAFSGFLSTFSCQSSTLLLTLVTYDRLMSVMNPLQTRDSGHKRMVVRLLLLWSISFVLAAAPLFPFDYFGRHFYGTNGVCLSLHIHDPYAKGWEYSAVLFICINTFSLVFILISYVRMLQAIRDSGSGMRSTISGRESVVATRFAIIITTDCACWLPIIVVKLAALSGCSISPALYAWLAVLVLPVNSALNPILYTLTTAVFKQQLRRYLLAVPTCSFIMGERLNHTQLACESAMSTSLGHFSSNKSNSERKRYSQRRLSYV
ncbi:uncharacterized protein ACN427_011218 [Glossina fuscipes fuscipes]